MRKLILLMLLLCAVIASGCSENVPPKEDAKNAATAAVQEKKGYQLYCLSCSFRWQRKAVAGKKLR